MPIEAGTDEAVLLQRREDPGAVAAMIRQLQRRRQTPINVQPQLATDISGEENPQPREGNAADDVILPENL